MTWECKTKRPTLRHAGGWRSVCLWTILAVALATVIPLGWLVVRAQGAKRCRAATEAIGRLGGLVTFRGAPDVPEAPWRFGSWFEQGHRVFSVDLSHRLIADSDLRPVGELSDAKNLHLDDTDVTDAGLGYLEGLTHLKCLSLRDCNITDAGLQHLKGLVALDVVNLRGTRVTDGGISALRKALPNACVSRTSVVCSPGAQVAYEVARGRRRALIRAMVPGEQVDPRAAIGQIRDRALTAGDVPALLEALKDESPEVRLVAIHALEQIGPAARGAIPELRKATRDSDSKVRESAARAITLLQDRDRKTGRP